MDSQFSAESKKQWSFTNKYSENTKNMYVLYEIDTVSW